MVCLNPDPRLPDMLLILEEKIPGKKCLEKTYYRYGFAQIFKLWPDPSEIGQHWTPSLHNLPVSLPSHSQWCPKPQPQGWWSCQWGSSQRSACHLWASGPGEGWTPSECCSLRESCHPRAVYQQRSASAGQAESPPCPKNKVIKKWISVT